MMTPEQKIKHAMLVRGSDGGGYELPAVTAENVDDLYERLLVTSDLHWDLKSEIRGGSERTGLPVAYSRLQRSYECESVAAQMPDGSWVGWTYWHGGGKHGNPEEIDWMEDAYDLVCTEGRQLVTVRTFALASDAQVPQPKAPINLAEAFERLEDEFLKFESIENPRARRPDLCAFLLLDQLVPGDRDIVGHSRHDEITLEVDCEALARAAAEVDVLELVRCGVRFDRGRECLTMFT